MVLVYRDPLVAPSANLSLSIVLFLVVEFSIYIPFAFVYGLCIWVLLRRKTEGYRWHIVTSTLMFILATAQVAGLATLSYLIITTSLSKDSPPMVRLRIEAVRLQIVLGVIIVVSLWLADLVLIHRCYLIWNRNRWIIALGVLLLVMTLGITIVELLPLDASADIASGIRTIPLTLPSFISTILITALSAGRIWWTNHKASKLLGRQIQKTYQRAISLLLESGLLYAIILLTTLMVTWESGPDFPSPALSIFVGISLNSDKTTAVRQFMTYALAGQFSGLLPTLMIVVVGLRLGVDMEVVVNSYAPDSRLRRQRVEAADKTTVNQSEEDSRNQTDCLDIRRYSVDEGTSEIV